MGLSLKTFDKTIKNFLTLYLLVLTIGIAVGLTYLAAKANASQTGIVEQYNGSNVDKNFDIPDQFPKGIEEMLVTTHNHI